MFKNKFSRKEKNKRKLANNTFLEDVTFKKFCEICLLNIT